LIHPNLRATAWYLNREDGCRFISLGEGVGSDRLWKLRGRIIQMQAKGGDRYEGAPSHTGARWWFSGITHSEQGCNGAASGIAISTPPVDLRPGRTAYEGLVRAVPLQAQRADDQTCLVV
jgi:hypothetical protein